MTISTVDHQFMAEAIQLAECGLYTTDPNPRVGCVITRDNEIVGRGWHERAGQPHAEIHALKDAVEKAEGGTAYITLEPCCHAGKTPPCTEAIISAGVSRVVIAEQDPFARVNGAGMRQLERNGVEVYGLEQRVPPETVSRAPQAPAELPAQLPPDRSLPGPHKSC